MKMLAKLSQSATAALFTLQSRGENMTRLFLIAIGYAFANRLTLPAERVEDIYAYFRLQHEYQIRCLLSELNELLVFNMDQALPLIRSWYGFRGSVWMQTAHPVAINEGKGIVDLFGISRFFSEEDLEIINKDSARLCQAIALLNEVADAIRQPTTPPEVS